MIIDTRGDVSCDIDELDNLLQENLAQLLNFYEDLSEDNIIDCYGEAFTQTVNDLRNKKLSFENLSESFTMLLDDLIFEESRTS